MAVVRLYARLKFFVRNFGFQLYAADIAEVLSQPQ